MTQSPNGGQDLGRMPPQAVEVEQAVLGAIDARATGHRPAPLKPSTKAVSTTPRTAGYSRP